MRGSLLVLDICNVALHFFKNILIIFEIQDILPKSDDDVNYERLNSFARDLVSGMQYLHSTQIGYHGNLKSSNCLIDRWWTLKISDFGLLKLRNTANLFSKGKEEEEVEWKDERRHYFGNFSTLTH